LKFTKRVVKPTNNFLETMRGLKHTGHSAYACPSCGSSKIRPSGSLSGWMTPAVYACQECGYVGSVIIEVEAEDDDLSENQGKKR
jgi:predicted RNA-binding Zn-ribbon protein involved in translation (DUF1610 family)